jgi:hypothetical protein
MVVAVRVVMAATYHVFYGEAKLREPNCRDFSKSCARR